MTVSVLHNQTLIDLAVRYCGTALAGFDIAKLNSMSLTDSLTAGQQIQIPETDYGFREVANYFRSKRHQPATAWNPDNSIIQPKPEGIDYWAIGIDFIVTATQAELAE
jgi:hypothetical protein